MNWQEALLGPPGAVQRRAKFEPSLHEAYFGGLAVTFFPIRLHGPVHNGIKLRTGPITTEYG